MTHNIHSKLKVISGHIGNLLDFRSVDGIFCLPREPMRLSEKKAKEIRQKPLKFPPLNISYTWLKTFRIILEFRILRLLWKISLKILNLADYNNFSDFYVLCEAWQT